MKELISKYLNKLNVLNVEDLNDEQVFNFFRKEHIGTPISFSCMAVDFAIETGAFTKKEIIRSMRKALSEGELFHCAYIEGESAIGKDGIPDKYGWYIKP